MTSTSNEAAERMAAGVAVLRFRLPWAAAIAHFCR